MTHYSNTTNPVDFSISPANMRARCEALVVAMVGKEMADKWWTGSNKVFGGDTPDRFIVWHPVLCMLT